MPTSKPKAARAKSTASEKISPDDVYQNNKAAIDKALRLCCSHLNGLPFLVADAVLARLPAYCEEQRVTLTKRRKARKPKATGKKSSGPLLDSPLDE